MSGFMNGGKHFLRVADDPALLFRARNDFDHSCLQILLRDGGLAVSRSEQRALVQQIRKICASKASGRLCNGRKINIVCQRLLACVNL